MHFTGNSFKNYAKKVVITYANQQDVGNGGFRS